MSVGDWLATLLLLAVLVLLPTLVHGQWFDSHEKARMPSGVVLHVSVKQFQDAHDLLEARALQPGAS